MAALEDEFGDVIRKARLGLEQEPEAIATQIGVATEQLVAWEKYQGGPDTETLAKIASVLQLPLDRLALAQAASWSPAEPPAQVGDVRVKRVPVASKEDGYEENCYLWAWGDGMIVIDPGFEPDKLLAAVKAMGVPVIGYLITHHHWDHVSALGALHAAHPAPIWVHEQEQDPLLTDGLERHLQVIKGDGTLTVGGHAIEALHTPGHTAGGTTFLVPGLAAVGDVLFAGSVGRTFMGPGGYEVLLSTVRDRLLQLPAATVLCPGHGPMTTVAEERAHNPFA